MWLAETVCSVCWLSRFSHVAVIFIMLQTLPVLYSVMHVVQLLHEVSKMAIRLQHDQDASGRLHEGLNLTAH